MAWRILLSASSRRIWDDLRLGIPPVSSWLGKSSDGSWFLRIFIRCTPSLKEPETPETNSFFKRLPTSYITCVKHKEYKYLALRALLTIYLSVYLSIYLPIYLSIHLSIYRSIYLYLNPRAMKPMVSYSAWRCGTVSGTKGGAMIVCTGTMYVVQWCDVMVRVWCDGTVQWCDGTVQ